MKRYNNYSGNSGVSFFKIKEDGIILKFEDGGMYLYSYLSAGRKAVDTMKELALSGRGLNTFVNRHVKEKFETKIN